MDNVVGLERNTPHDPCTMMTTLASVVVVEQSLDQGPLSSFLTRLVGKVVAVVVELCVLCSTCTPQVSNRRAKGNGEPTLLRSV